MAEVPVLKPREVIAILNALGFVEVRQRGSHKQVSSRGRPQNHRSFSCRTGHIANLASPDCQGRRLNGRRTVKASITAAHDRAAAANGLAAVSLASIAG